MTMLQDQTTNLKTFEDGHNKYRADIDGLRAIAVILVVAFHAFPNIFKAGFIGVDVFFVISGFLITGIIIKDLSQGYFSLANFYGRRIRRIFPALFLTLISTYIFGWFSLTAEELKQLGLYTFSGAGFFANISLWANSGYFDTESATKPLLHLWSLGIEEQYYILWPLVLMITYRLGGRLALLTASILAASFVANIHFITDSPTATFYLPATRFWELLAGALLAITAKSGGQPMNRSTANLISVLGLGALFTGLAVISKDKQFPGWLAAIPVAAACLIIAAGPNAWINKNILGSKPFVWFGLISFPLYLWHWPLLSFAQILFESAPPFYIRSALVALSILLAWLTFVIIERPVRNLKASKILAPALSASVLMIGILGVIAYLGDGLPKQRQGIVRGLLEQQNFSWPYAQNKTCLNRYPYDLKEVGFWFCATNNDAPPTILLLGNSFANDLYPGVISDPRYASQTTLSIGACLPAMGVDMVPKTPAMKNHPCTGASKVREENFVNSIINREPLKLVLINSHWPDFNDKGEWVSRDGSVAGRFVPFSDPETDKTSLDVFVDGLDKRLDYLEKRNLETVVFLGKPESGYNVRTCFARPLMNTKTNSCIIDRTIEFDRQRPLRERILQLGTKYPNLVIFDKFGVFCAKESCNLIPNGVPVIRDTEHLTEYGSNLLVKAFADWAEEKAPRVRAALQ
ncbi:acyltransferase family protein [Pseudomonas taiwanensis]|uniref:acyltransferase family protein n=1 Tax=Pseudomonas taiwanensis TaxID=470150 RepID=UPI00164936B6|nr:acyltransferase family protein [Pseudomonas taiwanensis]MBC3494258.1 acyltransferase [Pseudomonas taiwanensis]